MRKPLPRWRASVKKSYDNLIQAVQKASHTTLPRLIYGTWYCWNRRCQMRRCSAGNSSYDFGNRMRHAEEEELICCIPASAKVLADAWITYFKAEKNNEMTDRLLAEVTIEQEAETGGEKRLEGMTFVITGSVEQFENRKALQEVIEAQGGKATGSVTSKTTYLINNDTTSNSSKNKKAKELGVPIISEEDFIKLLEG